MQTCNCPASVTAIQEQPVVFFVFRDTTVITVLTLYSPNKGSEPRVRQCKVCSLQFEHKAELKAHWLSQHQNVMTGDSSSSFDVLSVTAGSTSRPPVSVTAATVATKEETRPEFDAGITETAITDLVGMKVINGSTVVTVVSVY